MGGPGPGTPVLRPVPPENPSKMNSQAPVEADRYQEKVSSQCELNPGLQLLADLLSLRIPSRNKSRVFCLNVSHGTACATQPRKITNTQLATLLSDPHTETSALLGHILIVEDLDPAIVDILGRHLEIDPLFFARHLFYARGERTTEKGVPNGLPSAATNQYYSFRYYRPLVLGTDRDVPSTSRLLCRANVRRIVGVMQERCVTTDNQYVAFLARMFSTLLCPRKNGKWVGKSFTSLWLCPECKG